MTDRAADLLQDYDDCVDAVASANNSFYKQSLQRLFSLLDETPDFAHVASRLERLVDFDAWYKDLQTRQQGSGMGGAPLNFPADRESELGVQLALFRKMSEGTINAGIFGHTFVGHARNINDDVDLVSKQLFLPTARALRRLLERATRPPSTGLEITAKGVPASDRVVPIDHNSEAYSKLTVTIEEVREAVRGENDFPDPEEKQRCLAEVEALPILLRAHQGRVYAIVGIVTVFTYLASKFADKVVGRLAENTIDHLINLFPWLVPYLS